MQSCVWWKDERSEALPHNFTTQGKWDREQLVSVCERTAIESLSLSLFTRLIPFEPLYILLAHFLSLLLAVLSFASRLPVLPPLASLPSQLLSFPPPPLPRSPSSSSTGVARPHGDSDHPGNLWWETGLVLGLITAREGEWETETDTEATVWEQLLLRRMLSASVCESCKAAEGSSLGF